MSTKTEPKPKSAAAEAKSALKKGADELKKAQAAEKKATPEKKPAVKVDNAPVVIPPPVKPAKGDVQEIMRARLTLDDDHLITGIDPETTKGEYLAMFNNLEGQGEVWQIRLGQLIILGEGLKCFGGASKYAAIMAASGKSLDSCKAYRAVAANIPPKLLSQGVGYTKLRHTVKVRDPEKQEKLILDIAAAEKSESPMTVEDVKKAADKLAPKKKTAAQKPREKLVLTDDDKHVVSLFLEALRPVVDHLTGANELSFMYDAEPEDTAELRELLKPFVKLDGKLRA